MIQKRPKRFMHDNMMLFDKWCQYGWKKCPVRDTKLIRRIILKDNGHAKRHIDKINR